MDVQTIGDLTIPMMSTGLDSGVKSMSTSPEQQQQQAPASSKGGCPQYLSPGALPAFRLGDILSDVGSSSISSCTDTEEDEGISSMSISPMSSVSRPDLLYVADKSLSKGGLVLPCSGMEDEFQNSHSVIIVTPPSDE